MVYIKLSSRPKDITTVETVFTFDIVDCNIL